MTKKNLPTSPHLQIYRWSPASIGSIMHRFTGIMLYILTILTAIMIIFYGNISDISSISYIDKRQHCECFLTYLIKFTIYGIVVAFTFSLYYHLLNGIRHLMWDIGKGFEKNIAKKNAILIMLLAMVLAVLTILFIDYFLSFYLKY